MTNNVLFSVNNKGIAKITLNRPELHNAFDDELINNLLKILQQINHDSKIKIVLLTAEGKSFSAGGDVNWMKRIASYSYDENVKDALNLSDLMQTLKFLKIPTIARVQGVAMGGGVGLVACCDMAIVSKQATFSLSEVRLGLIPAVISPYVIGAIGERAARRYFLTAESISADEALRLGLATQVVEADQLDHAIDQITEVLLNNSPTAIVAAKELINRVSVNPYSKDHILSNAETIASIRASEEGREGLTAFLEKRKPNWE